MKNLSLIWLILLTSFCVSDILAQRTINTKEESSSKINIRFHGGDSTLLHTEFVKLKYLPSGVSPSACNFGSEIKEKYTGLSQVVRKMLSLRGSIETDSRSNSLIITDTKERVELILKKLREWDKPDTNLDEIIKTFESKKQL